jgi:UPF0755 protein
MESIENKTKTKLLPKAGKYIIIGVAVAFIFAGFRAYQLYQFIFRENVKTETVLFIPENATYQQVTDSLAKSNSLVSSKAFHWVSKKKEYKSNIKTGRYLLKKGMNTNQIVNMLKGGLQTPLNVTFNNVRTPEELAGKVSKYIIADSVSILNLFSDSTLISKNGFTSETFRTMFLPNTYEFYWTTTAEEFAGRMKTEYDKFWNQDRRNKAETLRFSLPEVTTLASIVQAETVKKEEQPRIAGLYLNRLKKGQPLQADPTVKYAVGDFTLKRILNVHLQVESPYNTYKYAGLPPGPINFPETTSIDAVLNYEKHNYLYMCAKEDFSGYHNFAVTFDEHTRNAARYRRELDKLNIK